MSATDAPAIQAAITVNNYKGNYSLELYQVIEYVSLDKGDICCIF